MKLSKYIAIAALLNITVPEVVAMKLNWADDCDDYTHTTASALLLEIQDDVLDMVQQDPKVKALEDRKKEIQEEIEEKITPAPLTPEEEKEKFNEEIKQLESEADQNANKKEVSKLTDKIDELKEKGLSTEKVECKLKKAQVKVSEDAANNAVQVDLPKAKVDEDVLALKKKLAEIQVQQDVEIASLSKVKNKLTNLAKPEEQVHQEEAEARAAEEHKDCKPEPTAFERELKKIQDEEEQKAAEREAHEAMMHDITPNPMIAIREAQDQAMAEAERIRVESERAEEEAAAAEAARIAHERQIAHEARERELALHDSGELWTANMPEDYLQGYIQTKVDNIRQQLAEVEAHEEDSDSDSDSSDDDDE